MVNFKIGQVLEKKEHVPLLNCNLIGVTIFYFKQKILLFYRLLPQAIKMSRILKMVMVGGTLALRLSLSCPTQF